MNLRIKAKDTREIQVLMIRKGLIKSTLAHAANIHKNTLTRLFSGEYVMPFIVNKICNVLDINENNFEEFFIVENINKSER